MRGLFEVAWEPHPTYISLMVMPNWDRLPEYLSIFDSRDEFAVIYARLIKLLPSDWKGWPTLNAGIASHWSESGLAYIKKAAWRINAA